jgi:hypothetical protein
MKKTITKPDGSIEVVEGTAEEIAAYERQVKQQGQDESKKPPAQPGILTDEIARFMERIENQRIQPSFVPFFYPVHASNCELEIAKRGWWSIVSPVCTCGASPKFERLYDPNITWKLGTIITSTSTLPSWSNELWYNVS